jgi:hypothetical protein
MDEVRKPSNSVCCTPSSEPYSIYFEIHDPAKSNFLLKLGGVFQNIEYWQDDFDCMLLSVGETINFHIGTTRTINLVYPSNKILKFTLLGSIYLKYRRIYFGGLRYINDVSYI